MSETSGCVGALLWWTGHAQAPRRWRHRRHAGAAPHLLGSSWHGVLERSGRRALVRTECRSSVVVESSSETYARSGDRGRATQATHPAGHLWDLRRPQRRRLTRLAWGARRTHHPLAAPRVVHRRVLRPDLLARWLEARQMRRLWTPAPAG